MDALERRGLVLFVHWGLDFENSRQSFLDCTHRAYRQWVRSAQGEHAQEAIRTARRVAPEGFIPFVTALADYMPIYGEWLTVARAQGVVEDPAPYVPSDVVTSTPDAQGEPIRLP